MRTIRAVSATTKRHPRRTPSGESRKKRYESLLRLMQKWAADESGYEERTWPLIKKEIERNRLSARRRFSD